MRKTVTKKEIAKISKLSEQYMLAIVNSVELLHSIMKKLGKVEIKIEDLDTDTKLHYFDKYNAEIACILVGMEMVDDRLFYSFIKEDDLEFDDDEMISGGKITKIESYWFENECVFDVLGIIKNLNKTV